MSEAAIILLKNIIPNPEQPRIHFDAEEMNELTASIREHGVILPISVECAGESSYILHDGERRWRAAKMAGLVDIPAVVRPPLNGSGPEERLTRAIVANVQRSEMHPIEEGRAYARLRDEFKLSDRKVAQRIGKSYSHVNKRLHLVDLEIEIQEMMLRNVLPITADAVKALVSIPSSRLRIELAEKLVELEGGRRVPVLKIKRAATALAKQVAEEATKREWNIFTFAKIGRSSLPEQVGSAAHATCQACALLSTASEIMCIECPLVEMLKRMTGDK